MSTATSVSPAARDHTVLFYAAEHELSAAVVGFLAEALLDDGAAIVIATDAHRHAINRGLRDAGVDVSMHEAAGTFLALDARATLETFLDDGRPDPVAFDATVGEAVRWAAQGGRRVHAFGEMVALLWDDGHVVAAAELESLWNSLRRGVEFNLFCAYPTSVLGASPGHDVLEVCDLHSRTDDPHRLVQRAEHALSNSPQAARAARAYVQDTLLAWGRSDLVAPAALVVTELVSNAIVHAASDVTLRLAAAEGAVRIAVRDDCSATVPAPRPASLADASGRGLALIDALAHRWGTTVDDTGKWVWVEFEAGPSTRFLV